MDWMFRLLLLIEIQASNLLFISTRLKKKQKNLYGENQFSFFCVDFKVLWQLYLKRFQNFVYHIDNQIFPSNKAYFREGV